MFNWFTKLFKKPAIVDATEQQKAHAHFLDVQYAARDLEELVQVVISEFDEKSSHMNAGEYFTMYVGTGDTDRHDVSSMVIERLKLQGAGAGTHINYGTYFIEFRFRR